MIKSKKGNSTWTLDRVLPWILLIGGIVAVIAAAILTSELITILKNPQYQPVCNLNPIFSCSSVTTSDQADAFGFPNEFLGLAGFAAVATIGAGMLAGAKYKAWFWKMTNLGLLFAVGFISWLQFETIFRINALCIFCMVVWVVTIPLFWYTTLYNLREGNIDTPKKLSRVSTFAQKHHGDILLIWYLVIVAVILQHFWYYWSTLI